MAVYLSTATLGNARTLLTLGHCGELMAWFYPHKDGAQQVHHCYFGVYHGSPGHGHLHWVYDAVWQRHQYYRGDSNICVTLLTAPALNLQLEITDVVPPGHCALVRRIEVRNTGPALVECGIYLYGDWNMGGMRTGNAVRRDSGAGSLVQSHRDSALAIGGDALETWQCGKAGQGWSSNAHHDLSDGQLKRQELEIGDVNWACGFEVGLSAGESQRRTLVLALGAGEREALATLAALCEAGHDAAAGEAEAADAAWLAPGLATLRATGGAELLPAELRAAYHRSLLCLPLLCGEEGVAVAAPEFDPEFISCGGYGYHWPRDGAEYASGLLDAGYPDFATRFFVWCGRHQDASGLWHQRYFLNGEPGPNWCLPPDTLQIDQVGAVLWMLGKAFGSEEYDSPGGDNATICAMVVGAADYLISRLGDKGVHSNAFDTWETFIGSFTYSNAAIYAALITAGRYLGMESYLDAAARVKAGVLGHFVREDDYPYLVRGFDAHGHPDATIDSASLGAIEPFGLLDLRIDSELAIAEGTLRAITEKLDVAWEGGRAVRRFEGDVYVGGVPACVNTLWMARCCLKVADRLDELGRNTEAAALTERASGYLATVLQRATPTGLLPELMQGPTSQSWWAAPHGWAMASFVSGTLGLARRLAKQV